MCKKYIVTLLVIIIIGRDKLSCLGKVKTFDIFNCAINNIFHSLVSLMCRDKVSWRDWVKKNEFLFTFFVRHKVSCIGKVNPFDIFNFAVNNIIFHSSLGSLMCRDKVSWWDRVKEKQVLIRVLCATNTYYLSLFF